MVDYNFKVLFVEMHVNVFFVMSCLYNAVNFNSG